MNVSPASATGPHRRADAELRGEGIAWTRRAPPALFKVGDLIDVRVTQDRSVGAQSTAVSLEQSPLVEGALVAIDNRTGQIRAMVGGFSFDRSKFNRATQAHRQVGSLFKPFVYTAAIDRGYTPTSVIVDEPVSYNRRARTAAVLSRKTTTGNTKAASRCGTRSKTRGTCRP